MENYYPEAERMKLYGYTVSGEKYYPMLPHRTNVRLDDIAYALSNTARYGGHTNPTINVAAHSIVVMQIVARYLDGAIWIDDLTKDRILLTALLHDAQEAYIGDIPFPVKAALPDFQSMESAWSDRMQQLFPLVPTHDWPIIKNADRAALVIESDFVVSPGEPHYADYPDYQTLEVMALVDANRFMSVHYRRPSAGVAREFRTKALLLTDMIGESLAKGGNLDLLV